MRVPAVTRVLCLGLLLALSAAASPAPTVTNAVYNLDGVISREKNTDGLSLTDLSWANSWFSSKPEDKQAWQQLRNRIADRRKARIAALGAQLDHEGVSHAALGEISMDPCFGDRDCYLGTDKLDLLQRFDQFEDFRRAVNEARPYIESFRAAISLVEAFGKPAESTQWAAGVHQLYLLDQALRNAAAGFPSTLHRSMSPQAWYVFHTLMEEDTRAVDHANTSAMKLYFKAHAFPAKKDVGAETQEEIWTLAQHGDADPLFQYDVLKKMEKVLWKGGLAEPKNYAYLYDRVMLKLDGVQRYGTQTTGCSGTKPLPLEAPGRVDKYRASVGLPPLHVYIDHFAKNCPK